MAEQLTQQEAFDQILAAYERSIEEGLETQRRLKVPISGHQSQMIQRVIERSKREQNRNG